MRNISINPDLIMGTLSTSLIEPWWEKYWIIKSDIMITDSLRYFFFELKFFFIPVSSSENRRRKKNQ